MDSKKAIVLTLDSIMQVFQYGRINNICVENLSQEGANGNHGHLAILFVSLFFLVGGLLESSTLKKKTIWRLYKG